MRDEPATPAWAVRVDALSNHPHRTVELSLEPLGEVDAEELIALHDSDGVLTPATRCLLRMRAEGNPLYLEELTRSAVETDDQGDDVPDRVDFQGVPPVLEGLLLARVDRVPLRARNVLQLAAVVGRRFPKWILEAATSELELNENLGHLLREGVIHADGLVPSRHFAFRHGLYQEVILATLPDARRRRLHETVATVLEGSAYDSSPEEIASHYLASGNRAKAVEYLERASRRAALLASLGTAAELIDEARTIAEGFADTQTRSRLTAFAAELATQMGRYEAASTAWREVIAVTGDRPERAKAYLEVARTEFELANAEAANAACEQASKLGPDESTKRDLLLLQAALAMRQQRAEEVRALLDAVDALPHPAGTRAVAQRLSLEAGYHAVTGSLDLSEEYGNRAVRVVEGCGDLALELRAKRDLGIIHFVKGRLTAAREVLKHVYETALANGHVIRAQETVSNLLTAHLHLGELETAHRLGEDALQWVQAPLWRVGVLALLGEIEVELQSPLARQHLTESVRLSERTQQCDAIAEIAKIRLAAMDLAEGNLTAAQSAAEAVAQKLEDQGRPDIRVEAIMVLASVAGCEGRLSDAKQHLERAQPLISRVDRTELPQFMRLSGVTHLQLGARENGIARLMDSIAMANEMGMRLEEGRSLVALGIAQGPSHRGYFHQAREIFAACGSQRGLAEVRAAVTTLQNA